ncbi:cytochrome c biogenesis protein ResB [Bacillus kwashiorkori]|uniref:cytochrome c biogenesis protein ResB n=1 Tax=Bacillus kwashiorkori TaxID=1522318 RepID=UPI000781D3EB|nr:cytochrome c biogenesis protein ResB [Bacillus kwashiorkori]
MKTVKCECGHVNPIGTVICEACGRVIPEEEKQKKLVDMRYEGTARRSQVYKQTIIDKIWMFFSSVKVGVILIVITLCVSAIGTIFPQVSTLGLTISAKDYYEDRYGLFGSIYYFLGFHDLYRSWWYLLLVASIGVSLVICSLDRVVPLYKALKNQRVSRHESFLMRQRFFAKQSVPEVMDQLNILKERLTKKGYKVKEDNGNILAEKGRFSRWGPYVNHVGLIIFLIGAMLRSVPGMYINERLWIKEGETLAIPGTDKQYYLENHQFILEVYDKDNVEEVFQEAIEKKGNIIKNFQTNVTLYEADTTLPGEEAKLSKMKDFEIQVNKPLKFDNYALYQSSYKLNEIQTMNFTLIDKSTNKEFGDISINLQNPDEIYPLENGYTVELLSYFPDFIFNDNGEPSTKSPNPNNPAFVFKMITPDRPEGEVSFAAIQQTIEPNGENKYKMAFKSAEMVNYSGLTVRKDLTLWIIALGGIIFMIGVIQGSYWHHRRVWVKRKGSEIYIACHTNKNWFSLQKEMEKILVNTSLPIPIDQTKKEDNELNKG